MRRARPRAACSSTAMVRTSSSLKPASSSRSAISARPSSTGGLTSGRGRSRAPCAPAPTARDRRRRRRSQVHLPVWGVVKQRSSSAPRSASATWSSIERSCDGKSGCVTTIVSHARLDAPRRRRRRSRRATRWPVASTRPWRAIDREHGAQLGQQRAVGVDDRHRRRASMPALAQLALKLHPDRHVRRRGGVRRPRRSRSPSRRSAARRSARPRARRSRPRAGSARRRRG